MGVGPYGQPLELLVEWNTGRTLAHRVPGDTSGKSTVWFYPDGRASAPGLMQGKLGMSLRMLSVCVPCASVTADAMQVAPHRNALAE